MKSNRFSGQPQLIRVETGSLYLSAVDGSQGDGVALIQLVLHLLNYGLQRSIRDGRPDGIFGAETEGAVRQFQADFRLDPDGIVGALTLGALDDLLIERPCFDTTDPSAFSGQVIARSMGPGESKLVYHT